MKKMKKVKKLTAMFLCICMAVAAIPFSAAGYDDSRAAVMEVGNDIRELCTNAKSILMVDMPGMSFCFYTKESSQALLAAVEDAENYINDPQTMDTCTLEEITQVYNNLQAVYDQLTIRPGAWEDSYAFMAQEENNNGYYPQDIWNTFQTALLRFKQAIDTKSAEETLMRTYLDVRNSFGRGLCMCNELPGDVNFDGKADIQDVLYLQNCAAKTQTLNSSQKFAIQFTGATEEELTAEELGNISVKKVLMLQKGIAKEIRLRCSALQEVGWFDKNPLLDRYFA